MTPVRTIDVGDRKAAVYDGILTVEEIKAIYRQVSSASFSMNAASSTDTIAYNEVMADFDPKDFERHVLYDPIIQALELFQVPRERAECYEVLANCNRFGGYSFMHQDIAKDGYYTAVYFANTDWDVEWGGETLLCSEDGEPVACVAVRAGRLLVFPSNMKHIAGIPNELCTNFRYTLSVRIRDKNRDGELIPVDCSQKTQFCGGVCCKFTTYLNEGEYDKTSTIIDKSHGIVTIAKNPKTKACVHFDGGSCSCKIWLSKPKPCSTYSCRFDSRIWLDFDANLINEGFLSSYFGLNWKKSAV